MNTVEYGLMATNASSWIGVDDENRLTLTLSRNPVSMKRYFPDSPDAGTAEFAWGLLAWMKADGNPGQRGLTLGLTRDGIARVSVMRFPAPRPEPSFDVAIHPIEAQDILFDVTGSPETLKAWAAEYEANHPYARFQTAIIDAGAGKLRVWRRKRAFVLMTETAPA